LHTNFCRKFCAVLGQSPMTFKAIRFNFTAHSKSIYKNFNKSELVESKIMQNVIFNKICKVKHLKASC
jgi:hypothetical protein